MRGRRRAAGDHFTRSRALRTKGLYHADKMLQLHKSQDNVFITDCYAKFLGEIGGEKAHHLLHTSYQSRRRIMDESLPLIQSQDACAGSLSWLPYLLHIELDSLLLMEKNLL